MPVAHGYAIVEGSPQESGGPDGSEAVVSYVGPSANRYLFLQSVFGYVDEDNWLWVPRQEYPNPLGANMVAMSFTARPFDGGIIRTLDGNVISSMDDTINSSCWTQIDVTYTNKVDGSRGRLGNGEDPNLPDGTWLEVTRRGTERAMEIPGRYAAWDTGALETAGSPPPAESWDTTPSPNKLDEDHKVTFPFISREVSLSWKNVPFPDLAYIESMLGVVNFEPWLGWPRWSVMLIGYGYNTSTDVMGKTVYSIEYEFKIDTKSIQPTHPHAIKFPGSVTNGMIGMLLRTFEPEEARMKLICDRDGTMLVREALAADFDKLFQYAPPPP